MLAWALTIFAAGMGLRGLFQSFRFDPFADRRTIEALKRTVFLLHEIQETLEAGLVPDASKWTELSQLPEPWGKLSSESLQELRKQGAAVLPTLKRIRGLAESHSASIQDSRTRSAQAWAQALICLALVPLLASSLYWILPGIEERRWTWIAASLLATVWSCVGAAWLFSICESARWGGLRSGERGWVLSSQCAIEKFLGLVRAGNPADLAWTRSCELLQGKNLGLGEIWGSSIWAEPLITRPRGTAGVIADVGGQMRKSVQVSILEGRPCTERVETILTALKQDLKTRTEQEVLLLGTRALKPLFAFVAPAIFALLGLGLFLAWQGSAAREW